MKFYISSKILTTFLLCLFLCNGYSQETDEKEKDALRQKIANRVEEEYEHIKNAFQDMFRKANAAYKNTNAQTCDAFDYVKNLKEHSIIVYGFTQETRSMLRHKLSSMNSDANKLNLEGSFDRGNFKTLEDKLLISSSNSNSFAEFVSLFAGQSIGDLSKNDAESLRRKYDQSKLMKSFSLDDSYNYGDHILFSKNCNVFVDHDISETGKKYPNTKWLFTSKITYNCGCKEGSNKSTLNKATYTYTAKTTSLETAFDFTFNGTVSDAKLSISSVVCCPEKTETEKTSSAVPTEESKHFIEDTRDIFLNNPQANESTVSEASDEEGSFFREAGSFSYGVYLGKPIGDEADFFGFTYGAEVGYFQNLSDKFQLGATAGYARYTGKETDFGFETEGESFIPLTAKARYNFSDAFGAEAGVGYAISASEGGEGGLIYSLGPFWRPLEAIVLFVGYRSIAFGEGSLGALMLSGSVSLSKK
nr:hypothetical protein [uncultured Allomuricauda sp.]